jgi:RNA polymerase sigma factor (sigma-70 family)
MDLETRELAQRAGGGDVRAFVELTRRFQHFAFGSALAQVHDFQTAEDVVQEAFLAAWSGLPRLSDPQTFPAWLRSIIRHRAARVLRRGRIDQAPFEAAEDEPDGSAPLDEALSRRRQARMALAAIAELPAPLREAATLFYVHDCTHQEIAAFLGLTAATVNNRLHAARTRLKERMLAMVSETLHSNALPEDFARRIGRLIEARGSVVEALFDPAAMPDILTELEVTDESSGRAVPVQVMQRSAGGVVRAAALSPQHQVSRGAAVLSSGRHADSEVSGEAFALIARELGARARNPGVQPRLLETGIKVIDVLCPLTEGGALVLAGEARTGLMVLMEELARRLGEGDRALTMLVMMPPAMTWGREVGEDFSYARALKDDGYSEGTAGRVQTYFLRGPDGPWVPERLPGPDLVDAVVHLSREQGEKRIWPAVEPLTSTSRLFDENAVGDDHAQIARRVRDALRILRGPEKLIGDEAGVGRARRLENFFAQPFFVAERQTKTAGSFVSLADTLEGCQEILDGRHDELPVEAFAFGGSTAEIRRRWAER